MVKIAIRINILTLILFCKFVCLDESQPWSERIIISIYLHQFKVVKPVLLRTRCLQNATYAGLPKIQKLGLACRTVKSLTSLQRIDTA